MSIKELSTTADITIVTHIKTNSQTYETRYEDLYLVNTAANIVYGSRIEW